MDRSSFKRVESTSDLEKRQAFKAQLASKIDSPKIEEPSTPDNTFNGVPIGGRLAHPSLGEGTLIEINRKNNEVLIDFGPAGLVGLVLTQAQSFVHAPVKEIEKGIAGSDAFIGSEIQSRMLAPQDRDFRKVDLSPVVSADFVVPEKKHLPVGSRVWHPDLGACTIFSLDDKRNAITLDTPLNGRVDMVLSQVETKLRQIDSVPEHVPVKPLVREPLGKKFPEYKSRGDVAVSLPEAFKLWQRNQQFLFLTRSQHLTTEQANDVFAVLEEKAPLFHSVTVSWQTQSETESQVIPSPKVASPVIESHKPSILDEKALWHPDFGECSVVSFDLKTNELILLTPVGQIPCVLDITVPTLAPIQPDSGIKRAPKELRTSRVLTTSDTPVSERVTIPVSIPEVFVNWKPLEQIQFLTVSRHLTTEQAKDVIDSIAGKLHSSKNEYVISWTDDIPESDKRAEFKQKLLSRIEAASVEPELPAPPAPVDSGIKRVVEEVSTTKKTSTLKKLSVHLPEDFKTWNTNGQHVFLTTTKQLTPNEASDVLDVIQGRKPLNNKVQYEVTWTDLESSLKPAFQQVMEQVFETKKESVLKKVAVTLPTDFNKWTASGQYVFLTRTRQLTSTEANDVMDVLHGKPINSKIQYEIVWSE